MSLHRALALLSALSVAGLGTAQAQSGSTAASPFPPPPGQTTTSSQSSPFPPPPGAAGGTQSSPFPPPGAAASPFPPPGQTQARPGSFTPPGAQAPNPFARPSPSGQGICQKFPEIRAQAEKDASAIKSASDRKATREVICAAFTKFVRSEGQMAKFLETNQKACGIPAEAVKQVKGAHARTQKIRQQVCSAPPAPRGPSLSDALGGPILSDEPPKPGRGTFDTLTGNALGR
jgi:hypothetical protein